MASPQDRIPPHDLDAERGVLGAILVHNEAYDQVADLVGAGDFYRNAHQRIYRQMASLHTHHSAIDLLTVKEALGRSGELDEVGGPAYIAALVDGVPRSTNAQHYARIVRGKSTLRALLSAAHSIIDLAYSGERDVEEILDEAEQAIFAVAEDRIRPGFLPLKQLVAPAIETIEKIQEHRGALTGLATGFFDIDQMTSGLQRGDLIIVAGRPSMGKTSLAMNVAQHVGSRDKRTVGIFSLEMSKEQLFMRMLTSIARLDSHKFRSGYLSDSDYGEIAEAIGVLGDSPIWIDDSPSPSVVEMRARSRRLKAEHGLDLIVVDYIQLMQGRGRFDSRVLELGQISRSLKMLAKELNVPVVVLSQLSRAPEGRTDGKPQLSDLRESGALEQDADVVFLIYREEVYKPLPENEGLAKIIIAKQRNGPTGDVDLAFIRKHTTFENLRRDTASGVH